MQESISKRYIEEKYLPAAGKDWLLPLYDPLTSLFGINCYRKKLIEQSALHSKLRVLDIGCGTGTLVLLIKQLFPDLEVTGIDPDPKAISRAYRKAQRGQQSIQFDQGFSAKLPYQSAYFDRAFSSFMLHHLKFEEKIASILEIRRILRPGGTFHLLDFEHWRKSEQEKTDPTKQTEQLILKNGFPSVMKLLHKNTLLGPVVFYRAS